MNEDELWEEFIEVIVESEGINYLPEEATGKIAEDASYKLQSTLQNAAKFMHHAKRQKIMVSDIVNAIKLNNSNSQVSTSDGDRQVNLEQKLEHDVQREEEIVPKVRHIHSQDSTSNGDKEVNLEQKLELIDVTQSELENGIKLRKNNNLQAFTSNGNRTVNLEQNLEQNHVTQNEFPKDQSDSMQVHWLYTDGVETTIPETEDNDGKADNGKQTEDNGGKTINGKKQKLRRVETVLVKDLKNHEISAEQQFYYKEITEACIGFSVKRKNDALDSLTHDPTLYIILPHICTFIAEGVRMNVVVKNMIQLMNFMRMAKALLDNESVYIERYLHELIPSIVTCIVSKSLCIHPETDNHWALRKFSAKLIAHICRKFNTNTNNIESRVANIFSKALQDDKIPITSLYGATIGLLELDPQVIIDYALPKIKYIANRIAPFVDYLTPNNVERLAAGHIKFELIRGIAPILQSLKSPPDIAKEYKENYGCLGHAIHAAVIRSRRQSPQVSTSTRGWTHELA